MAKKKQKIDLGLILGGVAVLLAIITICLLGTAGAVVTDTDITYSCANLVFGAEETAFGITRKIFNFSFLNMLPYILVLAGIALTVLSILMKKLGKIFTLVATACFVVAGILFFLMITMSNPATITGHADEIAAAKELYTLGIGAIISGVLAIVAGVSNAVRLVVSK